AAHGQAPAARGARRDADGCRSRGADRPDPRQVRDRGQPLLRHRAVVGRRHPRSAGDARCARARARGRVARARAPDHLGRLSHVTMRRVLVANRGEIAIRIARACHTQGLTAVAVYSDADREAPHVLAADDAVSIGPAPARESYLRIDALIEAARRARADAVHPGYGLLAEPPAFARPVVAAGLTGTARAPEPIAAMGDKITARATADRARVPLVPGAEVAAGDVADAGRRAAALGYPVLVKAAG